MCSARHLQPVPVSQDRTLFQNANPSEAGSLLTGAAGLGCFYRKSHVGQPPPGGEQRGCETLASLVLPETHSHGNACLPAASGSRSSGGRGKRTPAESRQHVPFSLRPWAPPPDWDRHGGDQAGPASVCRLQSWEPSLHTWGSEAPLSGWHTPVFTPLPQGHSGSFQFGVMMNAATTDSPAWVSV